MKHAFDYICEHCGAKNSVVKEQDIQIKYEGVSKSGNPVDYVWQGGIPIATDFDHDEPFFERGPIKYKCSECGESLDWRLANMWTKTIIGD